MYGFHPPYPPPFFFCFERKVCHCSLPCSHLHFPICEVIAFWGWLSESCLSSDAQWLLRGPTHHDMLVPFCGKVCFLIFLFNEGSVVTVEPGLLMETSEDFLSSFWIPTVLRTSDEWRWLGDWAHAQVPGHSEKALLLANTLRVIINFE